MARVGLTACGVNLLTENIEDVTDDPRNFLNYLFNSVDPETPLDYEMRLDGEQLFQLVNNIKSLRVTISGFEAGGFPSASTTFDFDLWPEGSNERDLHDFFDREYSAEGAQTFGATDEYQARIVIIGYGARYDEDNQEFILPIIISILDAEAGLGAETPGPILGGSYSTASPITCTFLGIPVTLYDSLESGNISGTVTIEAAEYWQYIGQNAEPIYDQTDGENIPGYTPQGL